MGLNLWKTGRKPKKTPRKNGDSRMLKGEHLPKALTIAAAALIRKLLI
jgi:hypothetical protein